ncbi:phosphotransferase family protein [Mycobacterium sp. C31M]
MTTGSLDLATLRRFMKQHGVAVAGELTAEPLAGGRSNVTCKISDGDTVWVLRHPPLTGATPSAHDMAREFTVTTALEDSAVPVASAVALDAAGEVLGVPLSIVDFVDGEVFRRREDLDALDDRDVRTLAESLIHTLAALHDVDHHAVGLGDFGRPDSYLARQVKRWASQWEHVKPDDRTDVTDLVHTLQQRVPTAPDTALVHGDFRIDNTIISGGGNHSILAVVDWELSTIGDPLSDVALMCAYRHPAFDLIQGHPTAWTSSRWPTADELAHRYSDVSGRALIDWDFYLGLANFKIGVIAAGIAFRDSLATPGRAEGECTALAASAEFFAAAREVLHAR